MESRVNQFTININNEFQKIWNNIQIHLDSDNDIHWKKTFLSSRVPKEVMLSSEILLDTVINALMNESRSQLKSASTEVQNKFYDHDFRGKVKEWVVQVENKLSLEPEYVKYSSDPRFAHGLLAAGGPFITGAAITGKVIRDIVSEKVIGAIVSGIVTLILSAVAFKFAYDKTVPKAISKMIEDIEAYLESSKTQVIKWLGKVILSFDNEFKSFCSNNGWEVQ